jgi:hypothetical protein
LVLLINPGFSKAAGENVNMSVTVLERKVTDTINDFDFSSLGASNEGRVAGISSADSNEDKRELSWFEKLIKLFFR